MPRAASQVSIAPGIAPSTERRFSIAAKARSLLVTTAPRITSLWPDSSLEAEWTTKSAPCSSGFWRRGVANVLSTATAAPERDAAWEIAAMSAISSEGLVGDSIQTSAACSAALMTSWVLSMSTSFRSICPRR
jgi:hypothetical protein